MTAATDGPEVIALALEALPALVRLLRHAATDGPDAGLTLLQVRLLTRVAGGPRLTRDLAAELDVAPATISVTIAGLVRRGLVERMASPGDRRVVPLVATAAGRAAATAARGRQAEALGNLIAGLGADEVAALRQGFAGLCRRLDLPPAPAP